MSTPPHSKKRELSESSALASEKRARITLSKPFRSPLVSRPKPQCANTESEPQTPIPQKEKRQLEEKSLGPQKSTELNLKPTTPFKSAAARTPANSRTTLFNTQANNPLTLLQKHHSALLLSLRDKRAELDTLKRAYILEQREAENKKIREDMEAWKSAARSAAEYMFGVAKERVGRFGGRWEIKKPWDDNGWDGEQDRGDDSDLEREREKYEGYDFDEPLPVGEQKKEESAGDMEEFNMEKMLKILGIENNLLGWDEVGSRWVD